jgi:hypothetical protein
MILRFSFLGGYFLFYSFILVLNIVGDHVVDFLCLFMYLLIHSFMSCSFELPVDLVAFRVQWEISRNTEDSSVQRFA